MTSSNDNSSAILKLQLLENEFNLVMQQYEQANLNYIASMQSSGLSNQTANFISIPGRVFWGTAGLKEGNVDTEDECKALCSSDLLCTGATYNSDKAYCWTRSGEGSISVGLSSDSALITETADNMKSIKQLNDRLTNLNSQITTVLNDIVPEDEAQVTEKDQQKADLQSVYQQLLADRKNIEEMLKEYEMISTKYNDQTIYVEQSNSTYILWFIFAILIVIFTLKLMLFPERKSNPVRVIFWFFIAVIFIIVTTRLNTAPGFLLWGIIIVMVAFMQMRIIPSP
jgi:hypothetical protein